MGQISVAILAVAGSNLSGNQQVVFRSKRGDRLKILVWDGTGMVLTYKVLEHGSFAWPKIKDGVMRLSRAQAEALFEGLDWRRVVAQRVLAPTAAG
jgi:transposase